MDKALSLFIVRAPRGYDLDVTHSKLQAQLEGVRTVVVLPEGLELVSTGAQPAPDVLKLPVTDPAAILPSTCSCGHGPLSFHPVGEKDAIWMCAASPAACRPQQN